MHIRQWFPGMALWSAAMLGGCGGGAGGSDGAAGVAVDVDFPVVYANRDVRAIGNPTDGQRFVPGGDLYLIDFSSPSAAPRNLTASYTQGQGDVGDPEVSYDGRRIIFTMRGPNDPTWNLWEYDLDSGSLRRLVQDDAVANQGDDVDPYYLPDGRIVFVSNRQEKSRQLLASEGKEPYAHRDEYERERAMVLHVMDADGTNIRQISFNQSHDRNPTVLMTGEIMYARWDHVADRNHFPIFFTNPDGTNLFVQYGAFSPGNSYLHPREMPDGRVLTSAMPLQRTHEGGALLVVDIRNYSENHEPAPGVSGGQGQHQPTLYEIPLGRGPSQYGRYTTPYPLWDGTNRALVSWTPHQPAQARNPLTGEMETVEGLPQYGIYMFDLGRQTLRPVVPPEPGRALLDPVAVQPHPRPNIIADKSLDATLAAQGMGILNVKSVYDTDFLGIMSDRVLVDGECIPRDGQGRPDLAQLITHPLQATNPGDCARPARFLRVARAVPTPPGMSTREISENRFEMQQLLGYVPIEPDGSFRIKVPADTALAISVVDEKGRALQTHTNWIQVRPGETRTCNGCHSPRRATEPLNQLGVQGQPFSTLLRSDWTPSVDRESMAEVHFAQDSSIVDLMQDMVYREHWQCDPAAAPGSGNDCGREVLRIDYSGLTTPAPVNGIIDYETHIQPLWGKVRPDLLGQGQDGSCVDCHDSNQAAAGLDLRNTLYGNGRMVSYQELLLGDPVLDPVTGQPQIRERDGELEVVREPALVEVGSSAQSARTTRLLAKLYEQPLRSDYDPSTASVNHAGMLNPSELRLLAEWIDLGAQYRNDPYQGDLDGDGVLELSEVWGGTRGLDEAVFASSVHPILMQRCAACHNAVGSTPQGFADLGNIAGIGNNFVLTGSVEGDYNITVGMVHDVCSRAANELLARPVSTEADTPPHPRIDRNDPATPSDPSDDSPVLTPAEADYQTILNWIDAAAVANGC